MKNEDWLADTNHWPLHIALGLIKKQIVILVQILIVLICVTTLCGYVTDIKTNETGMT